jgi:hypothetical protein
MWHAVPASLASTGTTVQVPDIAVALSGSTGGVGGGGVEHAVSVPLLL